VWRFLCYVICSTLGRTSDRDLRIARSLAFTRQHRETRNNFEAPSEIPKVQMVLGQWVRLRTGEQPIIRPLPSQDNRKKNTTQLLSPWRDSPQLLSGPRALVRTSDRVLAHRTASALTRQHEETRTNFQARSEIHIVRSVRMVQGRSCLRQDGDRDCCCSILTF
jgi:hypothetical protein